MPWSRVFAASLVVAAVALLGGCAPGPSAPPTPTPLYTSDEDALAAAEQVYRDYIDAYNAVDLADPATFEPVYALTTGDLGTYLKKQLTAYYAAGYSLSGARAVELIQPSNNLADALIVNFHVCLNVQSVFLADENGQSQIPIDRPDRQPVSVTLTRDRASQNWRVADELQRSGAPTCG